ncbi:MAG: hypothetical protein ACKVJE_21470 [Pseudomonadales bacterium]
MSFADDNDFATYDRPVITQDYSDNTSLDYIGLDDGDNVTLCLNGDYISLEDVSYDAEDDVYYGDLKGYLKLPDGESFSSGYEISFRYEHVSAITRN